MGIGRTISLYFRSPRRTFSHLWQEVRYVFGAVDTVQTDLGFSIRCHPAATKHFIVFENEEEQKQELAGFARHCSPGMRLFDIGAHWGFFSIVAKLVAPDAKVVAIEPSANSLKMLRTNLKLNKVVEGVLPVLAAVGEHDGETEMVDYGIYGAFYFRIPRRASSARTMVPAKTIPAVARETGVQPTHIKIDVEGGELEIMRGARDYLAETRPLIFMELHGHYITKRGQDPEEVLKILAECGYSKFEWNRKEIDLDVVREHDHTLRFVCLP